MGGSEPTDRWPDSELGPRHIFSDALMNSGPAMRSPWRERHRAVSPSLPSLGSKLAMGVGCRSGLGQDWDEILEWAQSHWKILTRYVASSRTWLRDSAISCVNCIRRQWVSKYLSRVRSVLTVQAPWFSRTGDLRPFGALLFRSCRAEAGFSRKKTGQAPLHGTQRPSFCHRCAL